MRLGLISDVHGNVGALVAALAALEGQVDEVLSAGDAMHEYQFCNEVVEVMRDFGVRSILGNHEAVLLSRQGTVARMAATVRAANLAFVAALPHQLETVVGGHRLAVFHGSPFDPCNDYVVAGSPLLQRCGELGLDILVLGHTHIPMVERVGDCLIVNPGSLGESRDRSHLHDVSYAILDTDSLEVQIVRFPDPRSAVAGMP